MPSSVMDGMPCRLISLRLGSAVAMWLRPRSVRRVHKRSWSDSRPGSACRNVPIDQSKSRGHASSDSARIGSDRSTFTVRGPTGEMALPDTKRKQCLANERWEGWEGRQGSETWEGWEG